MSQPENPRDRVFIRLEVEIPTGVAAPEVLMSTPQVAPRPVLHARSALLSFVPQAECRVPGTNFVRFSASDFAPSIVGYGFPIEAHGVIVPESVTPPCSTVAPGAKVVSVRQSDGYYEFVGDDMPEAEVCNQPGVRFKLFVWLHYHKIGISPPDKWTCKSSAAVEVDCSTLPDCSSSSSYSSTKVAQRSTPAIEQLAYQWRASVAGFEGRDVKPLNGEWNMKVSDASGPAIVVDNSAEKAKVAARMCVDSAADACRLELRHKDVVATYGMPARAFSGAGDNTFRFVSLEGADDKVSVPVSIVVSPA